MSFIAQLSPNVSIVVRGFPKIVITLIEYKESLNAITMKNIKKGLAKRNSVFKVLVVG